MSASRFPLQRWILVPLLALAATAASAQEPPAVAAHAWLLADLTSGQILATEHPDEHVEPASLTKLMTSYLVFAALRDKTLSLEQRVAVSERAWRAPGSRMFIEPRTPVSVEELIRGMVVQSGNDACIALAEAVAGSEAVFVQMMNREAGRLGLRETHFMDASGLPDPQHYSSARDLYRLAAALIRDFPREYARYYAEKQFTYNHITQHNRNRLLWLDATVDGVKTGHTEAAGYCLIASSHRGPRRLLSVVLGASSDAARTQESQKLLNWGFQFFDAVKLYAKRQTVREIQVWKGDRPRVKAGFDADLVVTVPKGQAAKIHAELLAAQPLLAPVAEGQRVGTLRLTLDGKPLGEFPLVALEAAGPAGIFRRAWDTLRLWLR